jgi:NCS2 family nucleobase:cation symporter-2
MASKESYKTVAIENIYNLDGRVPLDKAIPFGLQHVMAMFLPNIAPIIIITAAAGLNSSQQAMIIQNSMVVAGIASLLQLYPVWRVGAKLPIIMGVSFTFVSLLCAVGAIYGYPTVVGTILIGGIFEGCLGLTAKYWRRIVTPVVSATVVTTTGITLLTVGANSFGGGFGSPDFASGTNILVGTVTLVSCLMVNCLAKGFWKQLSVLGGLIVGYVLSIFLGKVDFSSIFSEGIVSLPHLLPFVPEFRVGPIFSVFLIFLVSAAETIGDTSATVATGLGRDITEKEISGSLACDGFGSSISSLFGCAPVTSFSQNVGLIAMTKVVNRFTIMTGAVCMVLAGLFPPLGAFFATLPDAVLGGCTIMMFGSIVMGGVQMFSRDNFSQRNVTIAALSIAIGVGFSGVPGIFAILPQMAQDLLANNSIAISFIVAVALNLTLPKDMEVRRASVEGQKPVEAANS